MGGDPISGPLTPLVKAWEEWRIRFYKVNGKPRRDWKITRCLACGKRIEYIPKERYNGTLKCPHCGTRFLVPSLRARNREFLIKRGG